MRKSLATLAAAAAATVTLSPVAAHAATNVSATGAWGGYKVVTGGADGFAATARARVKIHASRTGVNTTLTGYTATMDVVDPAKLLNCKRIKSITVNIGKFGNHDPKPVRIACKDMATTGFVNTPDATFKPRLGDRSAGGTVKIVRSWSRDVVLTIPSAYVSG